MASDILRQAEEAESQRAFHEASRLFCLAADNFEEAEAWDDAEYALFKAGTCLERAQMFRVHAAIWWRVGDLIGERLSAELALGDEYIRREALGQSSMFGVISPEQWREPYGREYEGEPVALKRHRQAWAYMWAAEGAEIEGLYRSAGRYHRLSAICWELGKHGELGEVKAVEPERGRTEPDPESGPGLKWKLAARHYARAARASALALEAGERMWLETPWTPNELGWSLGERAGRELDARTRAMADEQTRLRDHAFAPASDLERLQRCWQRFMAAEHGSAAEAIDLHAQQLQLIQDALARSGRAKEARAVFLRRDALITRHDPSISEARRALRRADKFLTNRGTNLLRLLAVAAFVYLLVLPAAFLGFDLIGSPSGSVDVLDGVLFSVANVLGISVAELAAQTSLGEALQVLESLSAFGVLGLAFWMYTRSYEG